ncbi:hypothetical protein Tco_0769459 [Tanacetum coccineum]|uniref:Reverse transcriptase domain-containing protein n=1 Tax=Tanacetum coccineum TaxID=301880 RepID=A0ABQ4ZD25_9ASTR
MCIHTTCLLAYITGLGVATALAEYEANRGSGNGDDSHDSGSGRRTECATRECTYSDFLKCQPLSFKGTEGVVGLTQWFEKMESNSHVKTVSHEVAYGMTWKTLKKKKTNKYSLRGEIKKLEIKLMFLEESDEILEVGLIRRIQRIGYGVLEFLGIRRIDLLSFVVSWWSAGTDSQYLPLLYMAYW